MKTGLKVGAVRKQSIKHEKNRGKNPQLFAADQILCEI
jgi:hypothetical protein